MEAHCFQTCAAPPARPLPLPPCLPSPPAQVDMSPRSDLKDWPLLHASTLFLREGLGCLELATRSGAAADRRAAEQLARK